MATLHTINHGEVHTQGGFILSIVTKNMNVSLHLIVVLLMRWSLSLSLFLVCPEDHEKHGSNSAQQSWTVRHSLFCVFFSEGTSFLTVSYSKIGQLWLEFLVVVGRRNCLKCKPVLVPSIRMFTKGLSQECAGEKDKEFVDHVLGW